MTDDTETYIFVVLTFTYQTCYEFFNAIVSAWLFSSHPETVVLNIYILRYTAILQAGEYIKFFKHFNFRNIFSIVLDTYNQCTTTVTEGSSFVKQTKMNQRHEYNKKITKVL